MLEEYEKQKFIQWLDRQILSNTEMMKQIDKLGSNMQAVIAMHKRETAACIIVRNILQTTETMTLGPG